MATTLTNTGVTFPDNTVQTTAASGVSTAQVLAATAAAAVGSVGSYALMLRASGFATVGQGSTLAGSSLRYCGTGTVSYNFKSSASYRLDAYFNATAPIGSTSSGTWRCMGYAGYSSFSYGDGTAQVQQPSLWLRIS
jgi:hypothetical protein